MASASSKRSSAPRLAATAASAASEQASGERSRDEFKAAVKEAQVQYLLSRGRHRFEDLPSSALDEVEDGYRLRKPAARACRELLSDARAAWAAAKAAHEAKALLTSRIRILSAYRSYAHDTRAWNRAFDKHYERTRDRRAGLVGGAHGDAAVDLLRDVLKSKKAPPGFSNHSNGMAVDFGTTQGGIAHQTNSNPEHRELWRVTWFHAWLVANARSYGFHPLRSEEWHWDFR